MNLRDSEFHELTEALHVYISKQAPSSSKSKSNVYTAVSDIYSTRARAAGTTPRRTERALEHSLLDMPQLARSDLV
jgi:hypothetical protein